MSVLTKVTIKNFKCFKEEFSIDLLDGNYFIGANNAGKSAVLLAIRTFFDEKSFESSYLNESVLRAKQAGSTVSQISVEVDLGKIGKKYAVSDRLISEFGRKFILTKLFTSTKGVGPVSVELLVTNDSGDSVSASQNSDVLNLLSKFHISYIHPQESRLLLEQAQEKLKKRLTSNWGKMARISTDINNFRESWNALRAKANEYLSGGLTTSLQEFWPGCSAAVDLPKEIEDIIRVSDISFKGSADLPGIDLMSQGTGAQSTILYQTHYMLDSDKSLHRGMYFPVWLIEEPESFLHADIALKLGRMLASNAWLENIQMLVSTHSAFLLAPTKESESHVNWTVMDRHEVHKSKQVSDWGEEEVRDIGVQLGDPNFDVYFASGGEGNNIIIEDSRERTMEMFIASGVSITKACKGVNDVRRHFDVLNSVNLPLGGETFILLDNDEGIKDFKGVLKEEPDTTSDGGFSLYKYQRVNIILFPDGFAAEQLITGFNDYLDECLNEIMESDYSRVCQGWVPAQFSRAHGALRSKNFTSIEDAKTSLMKQQDVKDYIWRRAGEENDSFSSSYVREILHLMGR